jgi:hypothetical protein
MSMLLRLFLAFYFRQRACAEVKLAHLPLVAVLTENRTYEPYQRRLDRENMPTTFVLLVRPLQRVVGSDLLPVLLGKAA